MEKWREELYVNTLYHHGIKGQRWGVRRYQNEDGTLTDAGKKRYLKEVYKDMEDVFKKNISKEAQKVAYIGTNGLEQMGSSWTSAYGKKVTDKDYYQVKKAAKLAKEYTIQKYGKDVFRNMQKGELFRKTVYDFDPRATKSGEDLVKKILSP